MYASLRRYEMRAGSIDALMHRIDEEFAPAIAQEPGFVSYFAIETGEAAFETVSVFRDRASALRSNKLAADYVRNNLGAFRLRRIAVVGGEVHVSRATPGVLDAAHLWRTARARSRSVSDDMKTAQRPVLVIGATGRTGRLIVDRLRAKGIPVYALVRDERKARALLPSGVRLFAGDVLHSHTLAAASAGAGRVIVASCGTAERGNSAELVDYFGTINLIRQAGASAIDLFVFISSIYVTRPEHYLDSDPSSLGWKAKAEEVIRSSGVPYCIIRSGWLTDQGGGEPLTISQGDTLEGRISRRDLADVCAEVLALPAARGKTIDVVAARRESGLNLAAAIDALRPDATRAPGGAIRN